MAVFSFYMAVNFCCEAGRTPLAFEQVSISISISEMRLTMSIKYLLSSSSTKKKLTCMLAEGLLEHFSKEKFIFFQMVVVYDTFIKDSDSVETHTHEEADTLIPTKYLPQWPGTLTEKLMYSPQLLMFCSSWLIWYLRVRSEPPPL